MTVKISKRPSTIKKVAKTFPAVPIISQFCEGPIAPKPGPIFPIADADAERDVIKSNLFSPIITNTMLAKTKIKI